MRLVQNADRLARFAPQLSFKPERTKFYWKFSEFSLHLFADTTAVARLSDEANLLSNVYHGTNKNTSAARRRRDGALMGEHTRDIRQPSAWRKASVAKFGWTLSKKG